MNERSADTPRWVTNSPAAARKLRAADRRFDEAWVLAVGLPLAEKIIALRAAKAARQAEYDAVGGKAP